MLIIGGLFALALVALVLAIFLAREDKPQTAAVSAQESAPASEVVEAQAPAPQQEETRTPAQEETIAAPVAVAQTEQNNKHSADVVQPTLNEIVLPLEDGQNTESLHHTQGQLQELLSMMRQLQGQMQTLEQRVNYISAQVNHLDQSNEPNTSATFVDIPALSRNRHP